VWNGREGGQRLGWMRIKRNYRKQEIAWRTETMVDIREKEKYTRPTYHVYKKINSVGSMAEKVLKEI
jgi:hypothetical protein